MIKKIPLRIVQFDSLKEKKKLLLLFQDNTLDYPKWKIWGTPHMLQCYMAGV